MKKPAYAAILLTIFGIVSCGPIYTQPPEQQSAADAVHGGILALSPGYRAEAGVKVMAACLAFEDGQPVGVSGMVYYYYPTRYAARTRPIHRLERSAIGDCEAADNSHNPGCGCQVIDINERNAILVPAGVTSPESQITLRLPPRKRNADVETAPVDPTSELDRLQSRAGAAGKTGDQRYR